MGKALLSFILCFLPPEMLVSCQFLTAPPPNGSNSLRDFSLTPFMLGVWLNNVAFSFQLFWVCIPFTEGSLFNHNRLILGEASEFWFLAL